MTRLHLCVLENRTSRPTSTSWSSFIHSNVNWGTIQIVELRHQRHPRVLHHRPMIPAAPHHRHQPPHQRHRFATIDQDIYRVTWNIRAPVMSLSVNACSKTTYSVQAPVCHPIQASNLIDGPRQTTRPNEIDLNTQVGDFNCFFFVLKLSPALRQQNHFFLYILINRCHQ